MADEQLVGYRGMIPGCTYIPSKPHKYGVKISWFCKTKSDFPLNANIYVVKVSNVCRNLSKDVVLELCQPYNGSGQDVVTDKFFTSHSLVVALLKVNLTLLGTIHCNRKEIPIELRDKKQQIESSKFAFDHENHIMLASYIPQKNKNVILISSSHSGMQTVPKKANNPKLILDYNYGKKGLITMWKCLPVAGKLSGGLF